MKYDESDNALIRASRAVTDRVTDFLGKVLSYFVLVFQIVSLFYYNHLFLCYCLMWLLYLFSGGLFSKTEMSEVLTEIVKADPTFDKDSFLKQCEKDIIPNILEVIWLFL